MPGWIAPVLAPLLCSIALIVASTIVVRRESLGNPVTVRPLQWDGPGNRSLQIDDERDPRYLTRVIFFDWTNPSAMSR